MFTQPAIAITAQRPNVVARPECAVNPMGTEKHEGADTKRAGGSM